uniref:Adenosine deaminase domain-containing protein n=1 Tax=Aureoumbra lagunensis TaxID=44058 RepID=A0A7S3K143_9STRA|mmetsp:Transcript_3211/g.4447  ORF Transcript_3211/g.4447 Transcript_3211/m.4447 type:complete len:352 (-) Transcript_3211:367-1422(-)
MKCDEEEAKIREILPKVELHAHLSGSIEQSWLSEHDRTFSAIDVVGPRSLARCFEYFCAVAKVITNLESLEAATRQVLTNFANEGTMYIEIRTTPKRLNGSTENDYVATIQRVAMEIQHKMDVKLLLSLDRGKITSLEDALHTIKKLVGLSQRFSDFVVGFDICGDPRVKSVQNYILPALYRIRPILPITFHTAEIRDDDEARAVLASAKDLNIKRLGHCCYLPQDVRRNLPSGMGIELCPTSNLVAMKIYDLTDHHFPHFWQTSSNLYVSINTDDRGLFKCSLSSELADIQKAFNLSFEDLVHIQRQGIASSFHPHPERLLDIFNKRLHANLEEKRKRSISSPIFHERRD